jgi:hypothetical protein
MGDRLAVAKDKLPALDLRARTGAAAALPKLAASFLIFNLAHDNPAYCIFSYSRDKSLQLSCSKQKSSQLSLKSGHGS